MKRRAFIQHSSLSVLATLASSTWADSAYPTKPIKMIVPLAAGSAVDNAARIVAQHVAANMKTSIAVENIPGAAGMIGASKVAKSAPDGYSLAGFNDSIMTMLPNLHSKMPWNILTDFEPISLVATVEWCLVVPADSPIANVKDFMEAARQAGGKMYFSSGGIGSPQHMAMELFASQAKLKLTHVPYKGATQAAIGVAAKEVEVAFQGIATVSALVKSGKLKMVAVTTPQRMPQYPDVPTVSESGLAGFEFNSWFAMMAPAKTPSDITHRISQEIAKVLSEPSTREQLLTLGLTPRGGTPEDLARDLKAQLARYQTLIREAGIKVE